MLLINKTHQDLMKNNSKTSCIGGVRKLEMREMVEENWGSEREREGVKER